MTEKKLIAKLDKLTALKSQTIKDQLYEKAAALHDEIRKYNEKLEDLLNKNQHPANSFGNQD
jgi:protein-arginine kinase activator protein McsA